MSLVNSQMCQSWCYRSVMFMYFSLCCVYDVSPLMGQVLGKVLLTSRENELTIDGDFRTSGLLRFQSYQHT